MEREGTHEVILVSITDESKAAAELQVQLVQCRCMIELRYVLRTYNGENVRERLSLRRDLF